MSQAPGWYRDPFFRGQERYWDGRLWTQGIRSEGAQDAAGHQDEALDLISERAPADVLGGPAAPVEAPTFAPLGAPAPPAPVAAATTAYGSDPIEALALAAAADKGHTRPRRAAALAVGAAALLLVGGGVAAALVLGQPSGSASASEAVASAATQTLEAQTADMNFTMHISAFGQDEALTGTGAFDFAHKAGTMTISVPAGGKSFTEQAIYDGTTVYVNLGNLLGSSAGGKPWVSEDLSQIESAGDDVGGVNTFGNPTAMLQQLQSLGGTVTSLGPTTYDGTTVTEYQATLPGSVIEKDVGRLPASLQKEVSGLSVPNVTMQVYIGQGNLLKAVHMPFTFSLAGQSMTEDMTYVLSNYGTPVNVTPPPADEVQPLGAFGSGLGNSGSTGSTGTTGSTGDGLFGSLGNSGSTF